MVDNTISEGRFGYEPSLGIGHDERLVCSGLICEVGYFPLKLKEVAFHIHVEGRGVRFAVFAFTRSGIGAKERLEAADLLK